MMGCATLSGPGSSAPNGNTCIIEGRFNRRRLNRFKGINNGAVSTHLLGLFAQYLFRGKVELVMALMWKKTVAIRGYKFVQSVGRLAKVERSGTAMNNHLKLTLFTFV